MDLIHGQPQTYGSASWGAKPFTLRGQKRRMNVVAILQNLLLPWAIFVVVYGTMSFSLHYETPGFCYFIVGCGLAVVVGCAMLAANAMQKKIRGVADREPSWFVFLAMTALVAWVAAVIFGDMNFTYNLQPFYDIQNLNTYPSIDPSRMRGLQLMDAGRIFFASGSRLDLAKSMGFRNLDLYCVAPITVGQSTLSSYDFWAVGMNCCSGNQADFHCGEFNNPRARGGLRLMRDDQRAFYRLAVQQAEAAYNIRAVHPLFFHWMQDPVAEVQSYQDAGFKYFLLGIFTHLAFQLFCVATATIAFSKIGSY